MIHISQLKKLLLIGMTLAFLSQVTAEKQRPNIVIILADDLGYADVGFHGSDIQTPNLDAFAAEGVELNQYYVAPVCSPTRAGLMTGRYPIRFGMMRAVIPPYRNYGLDPSEDTLAEMLKRAGYKYRAIIGKWHLGHNQGQWRPESQGFTDFVGCLNGAFDYFTHERDGELDFHKDGKPFRTEGYVTDILSDEAVSFIRSVPKEEPYLLYLPYTAPHSPFQAKEEDIAKYPHRERKQRTYAAMVDSMDQGIGRVLEAIKERGDEENTLILFSSDNGGVDGIADNGDQRGNKFDPYNGGIRVVALMKWPKAGILGGSKFDGRIGYIDVMPTIKEAINFEEEPVKPFDGISFLGAIKNSDNLPDRKWFTYLDQHPNAVERLGVSSDHFKLVVHRPAPDGDKSVEPIIELFRIDSDTTEEHDLSAEKPNLRNEFLSDTDEFLSLRKPNQVDRYFVKDGNFVVPEDWSLSANQPTRNDP